MATRTQAEPPQVSLSRFALYFLKLGCIGFGGPIALVGYMQKDRVEERKSVGIAVTTFLVLLKWKIPEPIIILVSGLVAVAIHLR